MVGTAIFEYLVLYSQHSLKGFSHVVQRLQSEVGAPLCAMISGAFHITDLCAALTVPAD